MCFFNLKFLVKKIRNSNNEYCLITNSNFVVLINQKIWNISNDHNIYFDMKYPPMNIS
jgi:hypothetical protein